MEEEKLKVSDRRLSTRDFVGMPGRASEQANREERDRPEATKKTENIDRPVERRPEEPMAERHTKEGHTREHRPPERPHDGEDLSPLLSDHENQDFRARWSTIQTGFVDEPRKAVEQADELVAQLMQRLAQSFTDQRTTLEKQWEHSDKVSTEELRVALRRYRSFFDRLLAI